MSEKKSEFPNILILVKVKCQKMNTSMNKVSKKMGRSPGYLSYRLKRNNPDVKLLLEISELLNYNFFERYIDCLPKRIIYTWRGKELLKEREKLWNEIRQLKAENEKLWSKLG